MLLPLLLAAADYSLFTNHYSLFPQDDKSKEKKPAPKAQPVMTVEDENIPDSLLQSLAEPVYGLRLVPGRLVWRFQTKLHGITYARRLSS